MAHSIAPMGTASFCPEGGKDIVDSGKTDHKKARNFRSGPILYYYMALFLQGFFLPIVGKFVNIYGIGGCLGY